LSHPGSVVDGDLVKELAYLLFRIRHDPAKIVCDLAVALALGGDCLSDIAVLRGEPAVFGLVAPDPTVSRTIDAFAAAASTQALTPK
jgi:hypothetical protein